ncbi:exonuclease subunit SbcD [Oceanospirillum sediminis]|uniref:Nuclease SbcCD subunit D n=1 Tax=Oceanospirillum sediminis TaxID=2760088 RepID=A0A839IUU0_9GAMM|nr:exonuclease subunit SbcD [Oceanospirillum sediminis]MBB1488721.1 exonuclease subunit SbcD [Oceanospirillum sediminis]
MRILHTSDWHLGQHFYGKSREKEQEAFLNWMVGQVQSRQADALIVAGDLFDTGAPPSYARRLYNRFITRMVQTGCQLILLAGNHDSVAVLNESTELLACLNVHIIAGKPASLSDRIIYLKNKAGEPAAILAAIPFLRPRDLLLSQSGQAISEKQRNLQLEISQHYQGLYQLASEEARKLADQQGQDKPFPVVMTGHLTTVGAKSSDSVRDIYIGSLEAFPANQFPAADYIALGHIHSSQKVAGTEHIRYSGSPIALSFDEAAKQKSILCVDLPEYDAAETGLKVQPVPVPVFQPMLSLKGDLASLEQQLEKYFHDQSNIISEPDHHGGKKTVREEGENNEDSSTLLWLDIELKSQGYLSDLQPRIEAICQGKPVEVVLIRREKSPTRTLKHSGNEQLHELTAKDVFLRRLQADMDINGPEKTEAISDKTLDADRIIQHFDTVLDKITRPGLTSEDSSEEQTS